MVGFAFQSLVFCTSCAISQRIDLTEALQHYILSTLQHVNYTLINLQGGKRKRGGRLPLGMTVAYYLKAFCLT